MHAAIHRFIARFPVLGLLMAALVFRALIPAGFMPMQSANGEIVMQLCSGFESKAVSVSLDDEGTPNQQSTFLDSSHCGFSASSAPPLASNTAVAFALANAPHAVPVASLPAARPLSIHRTQSPRAPPRHA